jgi:hypothetical protein
LVVRPEVHPGRLVLLAAALAGLAAGTARAGPAPLDEGRLAAVAAGLAEAAPAPGISVPVTVAAPVTVSNQVLTTNQVGTGVAVDVNAAVAMFAQGVTARGSAGAALGLGAH